MAKYTINVTEPRLLAAITAAREAHNAALPEAHDAQGNVISPKPGIHATDGGYLDWVIDNAAKSWAAQFGTDLAKLDAEIVEMQTKRTALAAKLG